MQYFLFALLLVFSYPAITLIIDGIKRLVNLMHPKPVQHSVIHGANIADPMVEHEWLHEDHFDISSLPPTGSFAGRNSLPFYDQEMTPMDLDP